VCECARALLQERVLSEMSGPYMHIFLFDLDLFDLIVFHCLSRDFLFSSHPELLSRPCTALPSRVERSGMWCIFEGDCN